MSVAEDDETVNNSGMLRATRSCIFKKPYHRRTDGLRHQRAAARSTTRSRVIGWCTVATTGIPVVGDFQQPDTQALVVVHDVEIVQPIGQQACGAQAEGARLGEARCPHSAQLEEVDAIPDLPGMRYAERVGFAVHVEAGYLGQHHSRIEFLGVGLTGKHLDVVSEFDQAPAEIPDVNPLAAAVRLAAIGQQRNPHTHARSGVLLPRDITVKGSGEA